MTSRSAMLWCALLVGWGCGGAQRAEPRAGSEQSRAGPARAEQTGDPSGILRPGAVESLQRQLSQRGYDLEITGTYDPPTRKAVLEFQAEQELARTGMPSLVTLRALNLEPSAFYERPESDEVPWWRQR